MGIPDRTVFEAAYAGKAPWDVGKPQPVFVHAAEKITGSILDPGCGTGDNALYFASLGRKVTGVDYLAEPIARAKQKAADRGLKANFLVMDALALKEIPEVYDNAIDSGLFHCFDDNDRRRYVDALAAAIKPGGRLFLLCFSNEEPGDQGPRRVTRQELNNSFANGWTIESIDSARFEIHPDFVSMGFSEGGPKAWFAVVKRYAE